MLRPTALQPYKYINKLLLSYISVCYVFCFSLRAYFYVGLCRDYGILYLMDCRALENSPTS